MFICRKRTIFDKQLVITIKYQKQMANLTKEFRSDLTVSLNKSKDYLASLSFQQGMYRNSILSHNYVISVAGVYTIGLKKMDLKY